MSETERVARTFVSSKIRWFLRSEVSRLIGEVLSFRVYAGLGSSTLADFS